MAYVYCWNNSCSAKITTDEAKTGPEGQTFCTLCNRLARATPQAMRVVHHLLGQNSITLKFTYEETQAALLRTMEEAS